MPEDASTTQLECAVAFDQLAELKSFPGNAKGFWPKFLATAGTLVSADKTVLLLRSDAEKPWMQLGAHPPETPPSRMLSAFTAELQEVARRCIAAGACQVALEGKQGGAGHYVIGTRIPLPKPQKEECVVACLLSEVSEGAVRESLVRLRLAANTPELYHTNQAAAQSAQDVEKFAAALDLALLVNSKTRFLESAMGFCNGLAARFACERVSLGLVEGGYVRLKAMSRTEKFNPKMSAVQDLEKAMEECLDQDDEIVYPEPAGATVVTRDHEAFAKVHEPGFLCSVPLRQDKKAVGVVLLERRGAGFSEGELQQLRLAADITVEHLLGLKQRDRWFGARLAGWTRRKAARLVGPEHTWAKLLGLALAGILVAVFLVPVPYRVEGNFILRSDELAHLTAPFDGYINQVLVRPGDRVEAGAALVAMRTDELRLEEFAAAADLNRFEREAEKARAMEALADMQVNLALARQAQARLDLVRYRIQEAKLKSPYTGVLIEGDLRDRIGAPVKTADVLMKVARIDTLFVEAEVDERDIHEILGRNSGEISFLTQPKFAYPVKITVVEQAAVPRSQKNVFLVRCAVEGGPQSWWRPGMSGICKFNVDKRTLFWIATHRTVDFLRMKLWW